ncbi:hypothetical protein ACOBR2_08145 [Telmatobacter bradus]|uniref:hypothetical protein n=1 Tax=Telmatobacter bradus TaxID=474953 RepID=UPI003B427F6F
MQTTPTPLSAPSVSDVLQGDHKSQLSQEEIAKALAHHNRHHGKQEPQPQAQASGKKHK